MLPRQYAFHFSLPIFAGFRRVSVFRRLRPAEFRRRPRFSLSSAFFDFAACFSFGQPPPPAAEGQPADTPFRLLLLMEAAACFFRAAVAFRDFSQAARAVFGELIRLPLLSLPAAVCAAYAACWLPAAAIAYSFGWLLEGCCWFSPWGWRHAVFAIAAASHRRLSRFSLQSFFCRSARYAGSFFIVD